ncbi:DUF2461 domain-containing protein [bacterium]|nr:DUF2461 domain-containing protein [bacterium]
MARKINPFEQDALPPFNGFPKATMRFLRDLKKNNDRDWFNANKPVYEQNVKEPMLQLLSTLAVRMKGLQPDIILEPKKAMYRIYRDVRFSKDKSPYKTWIAAAFTFNGYDRKHDAAFYFHITPGEVGIGGGLYNPMGDRLKNLRAAIDSDADALRAIIGEKKFVKEFGGMIGDELQRVPQGYDREHPAADLLKKKQFLCWKEVPGSLIHEAEFLEELVRDFSAMSPFVRWLAEHS